MRVGTKRGLAFALAAVLVLVGPVAAGGATPKDRLGGDDVLRPAGHERRTARYAGEGFITLDDELRSTIGTWVIRLHDDAGIEGLRPGLEFAAKRLHEITGGTYTVAGGRTSATEPQWGEVIVTIAFQNTVCPEAAACAGPVDVFGYRGNEYIVDGHMLVNPPVLTYPAIDITHVMQHELGHILGLDHYADPYKGKLQMMHPSSYDPEDYEAGDISGLRYQFNGFYGPFRVEKDFVDTQFVLLARRAPTATEQFTWTNKIKGNHPAAFDLAASLLDAHASADVGSLLRLYLAYFKRPPDQAGMTYWVTRLRANHPLDEVSQSFAKSSEFTRTYGTLSNGDFVDLVYKNVLGRPGDSSGEGYWTNQLGKGVSRGAVMTGFSQSGEYRRTTNDGRRIEAAFTGLLNRVPTPAEYDALIDAFGDKSMTPALLTRRLIESLSYTKRIVGG